MSNPPPENLTFEQALTELEQTVRELEDGDIGLEEALARYETGITLLRRCYAQLQQAEQKILLLAGVDEEGKPIGKPFAHTAAAEPAKTETRPRRKKMPGPEGLFQTDLPEPPTDGKAQ